TVDIKSKAGGKVVKLVVDEGSYVKKGDLIAEIDPSDTQASYDQAEADLTSAQARAAQAVANYKLQVSNNQNGIADAQASLDAAKARLEKAQLEDQRQPMLSQANIRTAQAAYDSAIQAQRKLKEVTIPERRRDAQGTYDRTKADYDASNAEYQRQQRLLEKGFTTKATLEKATATMESSKAAFRLAEEQLNTLEKDLSVEVATAATEVARTKAQLDQAKANASETEITRKSVIEAQKAVKSAEVALARAKDDAINNEIRNEDSRAAKASTVRSRVSVENAKVQLDSTTVVAPRDGVVTTKYLEEGTIIPPGTSTFAQGTSIVQLSDVTTMYVECAVVEADISQVREGQKVRIVTEAYKGEKVDGVVTRVNPAAKTDNNITAVKVRVKVLPGAKVRLLPGM
ncbi:MAG: HlyD family efflux transporter periplasmic adaptor subunit, partial [Armatimonadota bacterium]